MGFPNENEIGDVYQVRGGKENAQALVMAKVAFINSRIVWLDYEFITGTKQHKLELRAFRKGIALGQFVKAKK